MMLLGSGATAQKHYGGSISGDVMVKEMGYSSSRLRGVNLEIFTPSDTTVRVLIGGAFYFDRITPGKVTLKFSYVGYKTVIQEVEVKEGEIAEVGSIYMEPDVVEIGAVTVKASIPLFTVKEDTIIFNAAAVKTLEGDETIEILRQMPGVLMSGGKVSVMGKEIALTYIDDKLIFGSDPMAALNNLLAADVIKIRAYDEPKNKGKGGDQSELVRVLNIETKSKLVAAATGHFLASYGHDIPGDGNGGRDRYGLGATANFFSERLLLAVNAFSNNVNRTSNRLQDMLVRPATISGYNRNTYASAQFERSWPGKVSEYFPIILRFDYTYSDDYSSRENIVDQIYFPSEREGYLSRLSSDTTRNAARKRQHSNSVFLTLPLGLIGGVDIGHDLVFSQDTEDSYAMYRTVIDNDAPTGTRTVTGSKNKMYDLREDITWQKSVGDKWHMSVKANLNVVEGDGGGTKYDSLLSTGSVTVLSTSPLNRAVKMEGQAGVAFSPKGYTGGTMHLNYLYKYENELKRQAAFNTLDGLFGGADQVNSFDYTTHRHVHKGELVFNIPVLKKIMTNIKLIGQTTIIDKAERIPERSGFKNGFNALLPSVNIMYRKMPADFRISYNSLAVVPYIEQLRPRLDNRNLYNLTAGNPELRQSYQHQIISVYNRMFGGSGSSLNVVAEVNYVDNFIAPATQFFRDETVLPEYGGYIAPAGSSLTTYGNIDGQWMTSFEIIHQMPLSSLKSTLTLRPCFTWDDAPSFREGQVVRTRSYSPGLSVGLSSNFSRTVKLRLGSTTGYTLTSNNLGDDDKYLRQSFSADATVDNIFKLLAFRANYTGLFYRRFRDSYTDNSHILNLSLGCKVFKRMGEVNVAVFDVLNRTSGFSTATSADYIRNSWSQSFGRYFTVNFALKFNKTKSGVSYEGNMNDGGTMPGMFRWR